MYQSGLGRHSVCLTDSHVLEVVQWGVIGQIIEVVPIALSKASVCLFTLRIIGNTHFKLRKTLWALIIFIVAWHTARLLLHLLQCRPVAKSWDTSLKGTCLPIEATYTTVYVAIGKIKLKV